MTIHDLISIPDGLVRAAEEWFGVTVPQKIAKSLADIARQHKNRWETGGAPMCWLKSQLHELGMLGGAGMVCCDPEHATAVLHVGFLTLRETPDMVERLKNENKEESRVARSRLAEELRRVAVSPINATAAIVGGRDE